MYLPRNEYFPSGGVGIIWGQESVVPTFHIQERQIVRSIVSSIVAAVK